MPQASVLDAKRDLILAAARRHGKICALLLAYSSDAEILHGGFSRAMAELKQ